MANTKIGIIAALLILGVSCTLKDIRPEGVVDISTSDNARARALVAEMASAHGIEVWRAASELELEFVDHWPNGMMRGLGTPLRQADTHIRMTFVPGSGFINEMEFLDGKNAGDGAGADGDGFFARVDGQRIAKKSLKYSVYAPASQYLWELPFRMATEPDVLVWAGPATVAGRPVDRVLATWGALEPEKGVDQYLLYIDRESKLLVRSDYTVRAGGKPFASTVTFSDHREVQGLVLPFHEQVDQFAPFKMAPLHTSRVISVRVALRGASAGQVSLD